MEVERLRLAELFPNDDDNEDDEYSDDGVCYGPLLVHSIKTD